MRITAQLVDALKGHHLWGETYDRELKDMGHEVYAFAPAYPNHCDHDSNVIRFPNAEIQ